MNNQFLIPANSKKSMLIFGVFNVTDLIIFGSGCLLTFIFLMLLNNNTVKSAVIIILPALITGMLVIPIPFYHNIRTLIGNIYNFYSNRRNYYWRGWCVRDEFRKSER